MIDNVINGERTVAVALEEHIDKMKADVQADQQSAFVELTPFFRLIDLAKVDLRKNIELCFRSLKKHLKGVIDELIAPHLENRDMSIISRCMAPIYQEVARIKGAGSTTGRPQKMIRRIGGMGGLWTSVHGVARSRFKAVLASQLESLSRLVSQTADEIHHSFNACCQDKEVEDEEEKALREALMKSVNLSKKKNEEMGQDLAKCREYQT